MLSYEKVSDTEKKTFKILTVGRKIMLQTSIQAFRETEKVKFYLGHSQTLKNKVQ